MRPGSNPYLTAVRAARRAAALTEDPRRTLYRARLDLVHRYAWAIPSPRAIERLRDFGPLVELGAGTGYWARLIDNAGGDVLAYDVAPGPRNQFHEPLLYYPVRPGGPEVLTEHEDRTLFLCWPPSGQHRLAMSGPALAAYPGRRLVYVGEPRHGCTGDSRFFTQLGRHWRLVSTHAIPHWPHVYDEMFVYERRSPR